MTGRDWWKKSAKAYWDYLEVLIWEIKKQRPKQLKGKLGVKIWAYRKTNKEADCDNISKSILEACQKSGLVKDDKQFKKLEIEVREGNTKPFLVFEVYELPSNW
jgi:Holliday junction resolvase RusA-like endonuclease